jgi:hypothetical protein
MTERWVDKYDFDRSDPATRLFIACSNWMDRCEAAEAERDRLQRELEQTRLMMHEAGMQMGLELLGLAKERDDALALVTKLREALRQHCIKRGDGCGGDESDWDRCLQCGFAWRVDSAERHSKTCLAAEEPRT